MSDRNPLHPDAVRRQDVAGLFGYKIVVLDAVERQMDEITVYSGAIPEGGDEFILCRKDIGDETLIETRSLSAMGVIRRSGEWNGRYVTLIAGYCADGFPALAGPDPVSTRDRWTDPQAPSLYVPPDKRAFIRPTGPTSF